MRRSLQQRRSGLARKLQLEQLEGRTLLAADAGSIGTLLFRNTENPFDVDRRDAAVTLDALLIANALSGAGPATMALDVDGDNQITLGDLAAEFEHLNALAQASADGTPAVDPWTEDGGGRGSVQQKGSTKTSYQYSVTGNAADVVVALPVTSNGLALVGGGTDVDEVFRWMGAKASGGDFLVLRATGTNAYNSYIDGLVPSLDSVATLIVPDTVAANDPFVADTIRKAEAIFFAGGDQANYVNYWSNTALEAALYDALARNVPIGGTSAGLAILGDCDFAALNDTITSSEALANPYDARITLDCGFVSDGDYQQSHAGSSALSYLDNVITDSHFQQRDRMGRLVTFAARLDADDLLRNAKERGIGVNEQTALLVDYDGIGRVVGNPYNKKLAIADQQRAVYFLNTNVVASSPLSTPLNFSNMHVVRASYDPKTGGDTFDLVRWTGVGVDHYDLSVLHGQLDSTQAGDVIY